MTERRFITWDPDPQEEIAQNVRMLLATAPGTVPLSRTMGAAVALDGPMNESLGRIRAAAATTIRRYEPRAKIKRITATPIDGAGLRAVVELES